MEVSTFLTGVQNPPQSRQLGQVTGKSLEEVFPNYEEITQTFDKLEDMIEVSIFVNNWLIDIGYGYENTG